MAASLGEAVLRIVADVRGIQAGLARASANIGAFGVKVQKVGATMKSLGTKALFFGAALGAMFLPAIKAGAEFEQSMAGVKAVMTELQTGTQKAQDQFEQLEDTAKQLGATTQFTASQVAKALEFLGLAGFTTQEALDGVKSTLDLAAAGALELGRAADIATDTSTAFRIAAADLARVGDVLAQTASNANATVNQLGESMKFVAPIAATLGQSIEQVSTALGLLANAGLKGSVSGTGLAQIFGQLAKKGDDLNGILVKYGLTFADINPEVVAVRDIIAQFQRVALSAGDAMTIFGARAGRVILALTSQGVEAFDALEKLNDSAVGAAERMAEIRMATLTGDFLKFKSALEGLKIEIFKSIKVGLQSTVVWVTELIAKGLDWVENNKKIAGQIGKVVGVIATALIAFGTFSVIVGTVAGGIAFLIVVGAKLLLIVGAITAVVGVFVVGLVGLAFILRRELVPVIKEMIGVFGRWAAAIMAWWSSSAKPVLTAFIKLVRNLWKKWVVPAFNEMIKAVAELRKAFGKLAGMFDGMGSIVQEMAKNFGIVLVGTIDLTVKAITEMIRVLTFVVNMFEVLGAGVKRTAKAFGVFDELLGRTTESTAKLTAANEALAKSITSTARASKSRTDEQRKDNAERAKLNSLLERGDKLNVVELKRLIELRDAEKIASKLRGIRLVQLKRDEELQKKHAALAEKRGVAEADHAKAQLKRIQLQLKGAEKEAERSNKAIDILKLTREQREELIEGLREEREQHRETIEELANEIEARDDATISAEALRKTLGKEEEALKKTTEELTRLTSVRRDHTAANLLADGVAEGRIETWLREAEVVKEGENAVKSLESTQLRFNDLIKELTEKRLEGLAGELQAIEDLRKKRRAELDERLQAGPGKLVEIIQKRKLMDLITDEEAREKALTASLKEEAEVRDDMSKAREARAATDIRAQEKEAEARKKSLKARKDFVRDQQISDLQLQGKTLEAAKLLDQKEIEAANKKHRALELTAEESAADLERLQRKQSERRRKIFEDADGKKQVVRAAEREATIEKEVTQSLASQVKSVRDLFIFHQAIAMVRQVQENRARAAVDKAIDAERELAVIQARRATMEAKGQNTTRVDRTIKQLERQLQLTQQIAGKRAAEAQLGDAAGQQAVIENDQIAKKLDEGKRVMAGLRGDVLAESQAIQEEFFKAPVRWIDAFIESWTVEAPRLIQAVANTMGTVSKIGGAIQQQAPNVGGLNMASIAPPSPQGISPAGIDGGKQQIQEFNDNRHVQMDVFNNVDLDNVQRQIGRALEGVNMGSTGEI